MYRGEQDVSPQTILFSSKAILFDIFSSEVLSREEKGKNSESSKQCGKIMTTLRPTIQCKRIYFFVSACMASSTFFWNFTSESHSQGSSSVGLKKIYIYIYIIIKDLLNKSV